jgi:phospholipase/lecithinase/hemolysin
MLPIRNRISTFGVVTILGTLIASVMSSAASSADFEFEHMTIFGDSQSDSGNYFEATEEFVLPPFEPIPEAPYAIGGAHFSNGRTWIEQLAAALHTPVSANPAQRVPGVFTNYAFGRARARADAPSFPLFDLSSQVGLFLTDFGGAAPSEDLYVLWIGSNDVRDALVALATDPSGAASSVIITDAITAIADNMIALWTSGARSFLVLNSPDLAIIPAVRAEGPVVRAAAFQLSAAYNDGLNGALDSLEVILPGIQIVRIDVFSLLDAVVASPEAFDLANATDPCLMFGVVGRTTCSNPNRFLFWDGIHATTAGHEILAEAAAAALDIP